MKKDIPYRYFFASNHVKVLSFLINQKQNSQNFPTTPPGFEPEGKRIISPSGSGIW
jgi:hypothetical protein